MPFEIPDTKIISEYPKGFSVFSFRVSGVIPKLLNNHPEAQAHSRVPITKIQLKFSTHHKTL